MTRVYRLAILVVCLGLLAAIVTWRCLATAPLRISYDRADPEAASKSNGLSVNDSRAPEIEAIPVQVLSELDGSVPRDVLIPALVQIHRALLDKRTRTHTLGALRENWAELPVLGKILTAFLVGGFQDEEFVRFREAMLAEPDLRVLAFVARVRLMTEIDERPTALDEVQRMDQRLRGMEVPGFNAKDYRFFWECVLFEVFTKLSETIDDPDWIDGFRARHQLDTGSGLTAELQLYNECYNTTLTDDKVRGRLLAAIDDAAPSQAKSVVLRALLYQADGRAPADMQAICERIAVDPSQDGLDRYLAIRKLRTGGDPRHAETLRTAFFLEMSQGLRSISIARESLRGLLAISPDELAANQHLRTLALRLASDLALSDDHNGELMWVIPAMLVADPSIRGDLEGIGVGLKGTHAPAADRLFAVLHNKGE